MIDSNTLTYMPFIDHRKHQDFKYGQSGSLLVGTDANGKKYIIKHRYSHNAANEYVSCWLAKKLGVPVPSAYLLSPNKAFQSNYAVAIEFLELEPFCNSVVPSPNDLVAQYALYEIITNDDNPQLAMSGNRIISYDFSESFCVTKMNPLSMLLPNPSNLLTKREIAGIINQSFSLYKSYLDRIDFDLPEAICDIYGIDNRRFKSGMISVAKRVLKITYDEIDKMTLELEKLYPMEYAFYYEKCILAIQVHMQKF